MSKLDELLKLVTYALSQKRAFVDTTTAAGGSAQLKPKIDFNPILKQINKMLERVADCR